MFLFMDVLKQANFDPVNLSNELCFCSSEVSRTPVVLH